MIVGTAMDDRTPSRRACKRQVTEKKPDMDDPQEAVRDLAGFFETREGTISWGMQLRERMRRVHQIGVQVLGE